MGLLWVTGEVDTVDAGLVACESIICGRLSGSYSPYLHCAVKGGRGKHRWVLRIDTDLHDIVAVILERVNFRPVLIPIEHFDGVII